jgi:hypothetical protein
VIVRAAILLALVLCTGCVAYTYERDLAFEPVDDARVEPLRVGESDIGETLGRLGAPLYVWEGVNESVVLAYGWNESKGWGLRVSRSLASISYDDTGARLEGWIFVFDADNKLKVVRKGLLRDLRAETRRPPAFVE